MADKVNPKRQASIDEIRKAISHSNLTNIDIKNLYILKAEACQIFDKYISVRNDQAQSFKKKAGTVTRYRNT